MRGTALGNEPQGCGGGRADPTTVGGAVMALGLVTGIAVPGAAGAAVHASPNRLGGRDPTEAKYGQYNCK
jgi:hypothetical protein